MSSSKSRHSGSSRKHKWCLDYSNRNYSSLPSPPGCKTVVIEGSSSDQPQEQNRNLLTKQSWNAALAPMYQVPMNLLLMYMTGSTISIYGLMMVGILMYRPISALLTSKDFYKQLRGDQKLLQMFVYLLANIVSLLLGLYKCEMLGILPIYASDWIKFGIEREVLEIVGGGPILTSV
ncbi:ER membrane protein complex subunit 4 isoform X1 [Oopsacas minuta]|uniref:ER membrane protein complex subunit 4 n=1 Tax=Oopsacas minuta TaxID=111878 RepID=A0AAV7K2G2_9METZ|nr:ER membrane protein complex subunit 4 isoform X1 [Oopsacas minuta]